MKSHAGKYIAKLMKKRFLFFTLVLLATASSSASAQKSLKGIVVDSITLECTSEGVSIKLKGTVYGTITSTNGVFVIRVKETDTLVFSSIGYNRVELPVYFGEDIMFVRDDPASCDAPRRVTIFRPAGGCEETIALAEAS